MREEAHAMAGQRNLDETTITEAVVEQLANWDSP
jgi:hypothetical protein